MLKKHETINKIIDTGIVAVIRGESIEEGIRISKACIDGGILAVEITYTVPGATEIIKTLTQTFPEDQLIIGAGTILDAITARIAILAGAKYIVSPSFDEETAKLCNTYQIPYMPGCMTINEMTKAIQYGSDIIKLFPGSAFGPSIIKSIKAPLPQINIMPTGGIDLKNIDKWFNNGVTAVGVGGKLASGTSESITETAKLFINKIKEIRKK
ncbi:bifunctional 2-keto-4-hydroxyglutarate aldolase/2-keto-3-deoxy-6-phosphogluconate aldolase [Fusobacterium sp. IOR10]|uniref:bifunctional 2-keto-4-hydroxyglutarate aldolase/2-keto-3-deoxy-6-phosphogluconate aldolase n=1 Tax=Fusobacterium sp. IOR10 TaxID=2665157 RepID=UPI0013D30851|nr:bifunctional 2-keto-4-hydroxyglutarate aldolase/2-keto-3-deoxy-6-phosphogluconate aldolase [Fusobacterium sp. IOR10]